VNELYKDIGQKRRKRCIERENDVIFLLRQCSLLDTIIGRQVEDDDDSGYKNDPATATGQMPKRDEFDRDMTSFAILARRRRQMKRMKVLSESLERRDRRNKRKQKQQDTTTLSPMATMTKSKIQEAYEDTDNEISNEEINDRTTRRNALCDAIQLVLGNVDDKYVDLKILIHIFEMWKDKYQEDFDKCFAYLSFVDLACVLVKAEFLDQLDLLGLQQQNYDDDEDMMEMEESTSCTVLSDFCFYHDLKICKVSKSKDDNNNDDGRKGKSENHVLHALCCKVFIPHLLSLVQTTSAVAAAERSGGSDEKKNVCGGYDPFSSQQSHSISQFYSSLLECLPVNDQEENRAKVEKAVLKCFRQAVYDMAVPVLNTVAVKDSLKKANNVVNVNSDENHEAIIFATLGQTLRLKKLVVNMISYWVPCLFRNGVCEKELAKFIFIDVIAGRILPILTTWTNILTSPEGGMISITNLETENGNTAMDIKRAPSIEKEVLSEIWDIVKKTGWLEEEQFMLSAAPLRAAANIHKLL